MHYLYRHIRTDKNEPFYIGVGTCVFYKNTFYFSRAFEKSNRNNLWKKIVKKTDYVVEIMIISDSYEYIKKKEIEFISLYGRIDLKTGSLTNLTEGGDGCLGLSAESKKRRNDKLKNRKVSEHTKKLLSDGRKGMDNPNYGNKYSDETKDKISKANKGRQNFLGKNHSKETKKKISEGRIGSKHWRSRKVLNAVTGEIYSTVTEAAKSIGINRGYLSNMLSGKSKNKTNFKYI